MNATTEGFRRGFVPGFDCRLATLRNGLAHRGHRLSNAMVLGLSGALCFCYADHRRNQRIPFITVAGLSDQTLEGLASSLNLYLQRGRHEGGGAGVVEQLLAEGVPVNAAVYRPLIRSYQHRGAQLRLAEATTVGFHFVTLTEHDAADDTFTVFETDSATPFVVTRHELMEAWCYDARHRRPLRDPFQPCDGQWYTLQAPADLAPLLPTAVRHAANRVVHGFFHPSTEWMGISGLRSFREESARWHQEDEVMLGRSVSFMRILEFWLTGGGFGRKLYGRFLGEAAQPLGDPSLRELGRLFGETAGQWSAFVAALQGTVTAGPGAKMAVDRPALAQVVAAHAGRLADREEEQMERLARWVRA